MQLELLELDDVLLEDPSDEICVTDEYDELLEDSDWVDVDELSGACSSSDEESSSPEGASGGGDELSPRLEPVLGGAGELSPRSNPVLGGAVFVSAFGEYELSPSQLHGLVADAGLPAPAAVVAALESVPCGLAGAVLTALTASPAAFSLEFA